VAVATIALWSRRLGTQLKRQTTASLLLYTSDLCKTSHHQSLTGIAANTDTVWGSPGCQATNDEIWKV